MYIFSYGSLTNEQSRKQTLKNSALVAEGVLLRGYRRKMNAPYKDGFLYLNMVPLENSEVSGAIIEVSKSDIPALELRELGSQKVDVSSNLSRKLTGPVYAYIQPDKSFPEMKILQSYINTCTNDLSLEEKEHWLKTTIIENETINDTKNPIYEFPA